MAYISKKAEAMAGDSLQPPCDTAEYCGFGEQMEWMLQWSGKYQLGDCLKKFRLESAVCFGHIKVWICP